MATPIDLSALPPPEPLVRVLDAIEGSAGPLEFLLSREPFPLYPLLAAAGWRHELRHEGTGVVLRLTRVRGP